MSGWCARPRLDGVAPVELGPARVDSRGGGGERPRDAWWPLTVPAPSPSQPPVARPSARKRKYLRPLHRFLNQSLSFFAVHSFSDRGLVPHVADVSSHLPFYLIF